MDGVLPPGGVERDLPVPERLRLAPGGWLDPPQAPRDLAEGVPPPLLRRRVVAQRPGTGVVQRRAGHHDPVPLPGIGDPVTLAAGSGMRTRHGPYGTRGEPVARTTRTAGSGDGLAGMPVPRPGPTSHLCGMTDTLIADGDGIYDPAAYSDRLVLGLKGTLSEAELHLLKGRLIAGMRHKAAKGELRVALPAGLEYDQDGRPAVCADEAVREAIATVFRRFAELGSARQVMLSLLADGLELPRRHLRAD